MPAVKTILYCEDDPVVRHVYKKRMEKEGFHVLYAEDGLEALKCLHKLVPDLVVLDLMMPKFSGEEVLRYICNEPRLHEVPLIILSTNPEVEQEYAQMSGRADKYLVKYHCSPDKLLAVIQEIFNGPAQETLGDLGGGSDTKMFEKIKQLVVGKAAG
jgi:two-component system phosphate regulon response regulator PhoB